MSRIGKKPITISEGVTVEEKNSALEIKGPKGELVLPLLSDLTVEKKENEIVISPTNTKKQARANWGTMASLLISAIKGVKEGFVKELQLEGIGFKAVLEGDMLVLNVGFSHQVKFKPQEGVTLEVKKNIITVSGINKQLVGETAAQIRRIKKPEPYKGKGIRYVGEVVRRKAGKKVAGVGDK